MKKTVLYATIALIVIMAIAETSIVAISPFILVLFWMYQDIFQKINRSVAISTVSIVMVLINFAASFSDGLALVDLVYWLVVTLAFIDKKGK